MAAFRENILNSHPNKNGIAYYIYINGSTHTMTITAVKNQAAAINTIDKYWTHCPSGTQIQTQLPLIAIIQHKIMIHQCSVLRKIRIIALNL